MRQPALSVVLACSSRAPVEAVVAALDKACEGTASELIVVFAGDKPPPEWVCGQSPELRIECRPAGSLTPVLWGAGCHVARGSIVAFTTDQVRVAPTWAQTLLRSIESGAVGAGGPIELAPGADPATAAAYFLRFSGFTPEAWPTSAPARDIPGDNAAYRRDALLRHADLLRDGFWEVEFHRRFEREGLALQMLPEATATLVGPVAIGEMLRQRFLHGREFGSSRVRRHAESRVKLLLAAPLVPFVLLARIGRRAWAAPQRRGRFLAALPWLGALAGAWAAGEAAGALRTDRGGHD